MRMKIVTKNILIVGLLLVFNIFNNYDFNAQYNQRTRFLFNVH